MSIDDLIASEVGGTLGEMIRDVNDDERTHYSSSNGNIEISGKGIDNRALRNVVNATTTIATTRREKYLIV